MAHRSQPQARSAEKQFYARIEGSFNRIIRHGSSSKDYWWEVTDKSGTTYFYGGTSGVDAKAVLTTAEGNIAHWALLEVRDADGNFVRYHYEKVEDTGLAQGSVPGYQLYIDKITYTGHRGNEGKYSVLFTRDRELGEAKRKDVSLTANLGFKQVTADLLRKVEVQFEGKNIRSYEFTYKEGAFYKTLLTGVRELDAAGQLFTAHQFDYFDEVNKGESFQPFLSPQGWSAQSDGVRGDFINPLTHFNDDASALSGTKSKDFSVGMAVTVGFDPIVTAKCNSIGGNFGYSQSTSEGVLTLMDIDGDGLSDKVFVSRQGLSYRPNESGPKGGTTFGTLRSIQLSGTSSFHQEKSRTISGGLEAHVGCGVSAFVGASASKTTSTTSVYFTEVNGDQLPDIVVNGRVYFNHIDLSGNPVFTLSSGDTPSPIQQNGNLKGEILGGDTAEQEAAIDENPLHDMVRMWQAPYAGRISITAPVQLLQPADGRQEENVDGVRVAIQLKGNEVWNTTIAATDYSLHTPSGVSNLSVQKGDRVYFRVQSVNNGLADSLQWSPVITYKNQDQTVVDANTKKLYEFAIASDFILTAKQEITAPIAGRVRVEGQLIKPVSSDDVHVEIVRLKDQKVEAVVWQADYRWDEVVNELIAQEFAVQTAETYAFRIRTGTTIDWTAFQWKPRLYYLSSSDPNYATVTDAQGKALLEFFPVVDYSVYSLDKSASLPWQVNAEVSTVQITPKLGVLPITNGQVTLAIKKTNQLLAKKVLSIHQGQVSGGDAFSVNAQKDEQLFIEYYTADEKLLPFILAAQADIKAGSKTVTVEAGLFAQQSEAIFGPMYRHWGHFAYNGNRDRALRPINEAELKLSDKLKNSKHSDMDNLEKGEDLQNRDGFNPAEEVFIMLVPFGKEGIWNGYDNYTYINGSMMRSSRYGEDDLQASTTATSGIGAIPKISVSRSASFSGGGGAGFVSGSYGKTIGDSKVISDFSDMNGDRYPDIVTQKGIQYTDALGELSDQVLNLNEENHQTTMNSDGVTLSGSFTLSKSEGTASNIKKTRVSVGGGSNSAGLNGNFAKGDNQTNFSYLDINGDGLPDRVREGGRVALNLGYGFAPEEQWGFGQIQSGESKSYGGGLGITLFDGSISAGIGVSRSENEINTSLQDMNGDGLVDEVFYSDGQPLRVRLNLGNGFDQAVVWNGATHINKSYSTGESANVAFTAGIYIPIPGIKICINPSTSVGQGMSRDLSRMSDVDGDGNPDFLESSKDNDLTVSRSAIGRTNLLKSVQRPLGASFTLDYERQGNTYLMPNAVWTLASVEVNDGVAGDGVDKMFTTFVYEDGYFDRHEREFYGFKKVITRTHNTGQNNTVYRSTEQVFHTDNYYQKGLLHTQTLLDGNGQKYTEQENTYNLKDALTGQNVTITSSTTISIFPALIKIEERFYEGQSSAGKSNRSSFSFDGYGNMTSIIDEGDMDTKEDDLSAVVTYHTLSVPYIVGTPKSIIITGNGKTYRRRETSIDQSGNLTQIRQYLESGEAAIHDMEYDAYGNLIKITRPANAKAERLSIEYSYDPQVNTYVLKASNSYGYSSETTYDYRFGQLVSSKDLNEQEVIYEIDNLGRVTSITGPYEKASNAGYTIRFEYHPEATVPWALTKHYDPANPGNDLETAIFVDGLGRILQTKKDGALHAGDGATDSEQMIVSGRMLFDGLGRPTQAYYPITENMGNIGVFNTTFDRVTAVTTTYDILDRGLSVTLPDGSGTQTNYGFDSDQKGIKQFSTKTIDANGKVSQQLTDLRGRVISTKKLTSYGAVWTSFVYNAMGEEIAATDDLGHTTTSIYDWLGRRINRIHPDAGLTTFTFDLAGNMIEMQSANLRQKGEVISYAYEYERLTDITYPLNLENNVHYQYGAAGEKYNRAGKIILQEDGSGAQEFFYGPLGEVVKNVRTIIIPQHGEQTYVTEWQYDTWNRLTSMIYPDGEKVEYAYNSGGLLRSMEGKKGGTTYTYVKQLGYDKFEQRVFLAYGNGTKTTYLYEDDRRRLAHMTAKTAAGRSMMDNAYTYDKVNNILNLKNNAPVPSPNLMGGSSEYSYEYDDLYRLTDAKGSFKASNEEHRYKLEMKYNSVGSILEKAQSHERSSGGTNWTTQKKTSYTQSYTYSIQQPHAAVHIGEQTYSYDANGNQTGWTHDKSGQRRAILWDEENRIRSIMDNGATYHYIYDASGERVLKGHSSGQALHVNGEYKGGSGNMGNYTVYVNPFIVLKSGGYTKHYYIEGQRIVSKLGSGMNDSGKGPLKAGEGEVNYAGKKQQVEEGIVKNLKFLGQDGAILTAGKSGKVPPGQLNGKGNGSGTATSTVESFQYYYHPDHLGSTSYVTDASGEVYQHLEYFAFGETFVEEHSNTDRTPYLFNGKELDEETELYYYGARYYDAKTSIWQSIDPLAEKYTSVSPYNYTLNNPINFTDPDGRKVKVTGENQETINESLEAIRNTVKEKYRNSIQLNSDGYVELGKGRGRNFRSLRQLVKSEKTVEFSVTKFYKAKENGQLVTKAMNPSIMDQTLEQLSYLQGEGVSREDFIKNLESDPNFAPIIEQARQGDQAMENGDIGTKGLAIVPGYESSDGASPNENAHAYVDPRNADGKKGIAKVTAHELYGHVRTYFQFGGNSWTHNHKRADRRIRNAERSVR